MAPPASEPKTQTLIPAEIRRFFGYSEQQAERTVAMKGRLRAFNVCMTEVAKAFDQLAALESQIGQVYSNLSTVFVTDANEVAAQLSTMNKVREAASNIATEQTEFTRFLSRAAAQLGSLRDGQVSFSKSWAASCDKAFGNVEKTRVAVVNAVRQFEIAKHSLAPGTDPWLIGRHLFRAVVQPLASDLPDISSPSFWLRQIDQVLRNAVNRAITSENTYQKEMSDLALKLSETEHKLIASLQKIFGDHHQLIKLHYNNVLLHYGNVGKFISSLDPAQPFEAYNQKHDVHNSIAWNTTRTLSEFPFTMPSSKVIKEGYLMRPGGGFWKSSYQDAWGVISDKGFLHVFPHSRSNIVTRAIGWAETKKFETMEQPNEAALSILLRRPRVAVGIPIPSELYASSGGGGITETLAKQIQRQGEEHLFEITVSGGPGDGDPSPEGKHVFKCETEEEMVDWITAIKRALEFVPGQQGRKMDSPVLGSVVGSVAASAVASRVASSTGSPERSTAAGSQVPSRTSPLKITNNNNNDTSDPSDDLLGSLQDIPVLKAESPVSSGNPWNAFPPPPSSSTNQSQSTNLFQTEELDDDFFSDSFAGNNNNGSSSLDGVLTPLAPPPLTTSGASKNVDDWIADFN